MLYVDSSALIKHYVREAGTDALNTRLKAESVLPPTVFISVIGYAEVLTTFARRLREKLLSKAESNLLQKQFRDEWMFDLAHVELTAGVLLFVPRLVNDHPLKAADAIHLASALWLRDALRLGRQFGQVGRSFTLACSDRQLKHAALAEGLEVFDPEQTP